MASSFVRCLVYTRKDYISNEQIPRKNLWVENPRNHIRGQEICKKKNKYSNQGKLQIRQWHC